MGTSVRTGSGSDWIPKRGQVKNGIALKVVGVILVALAFLSACGGNARTRNTQTTAVETRQVTDDLGRTVTIPLKVSRVVSLAPNLTENIFAVGAGDRLVGVTTFCNYPEQAKAIAKIGDTMTPNMESILALRPDIVFVSTASQIETFMKTLEANGISVYVTNPLSLKDLFKNLRQLGVIFETTEAAERIVKDLETREADVREKCDTVDPRLRVTVFVQISREPLFTVGGGSFIGELVSSAGGSLVTYHIQTPFPKLSKETALALNPEAIILSDSEDNREPNEAFKSSPAVRNGRVYSVDADLLSRPGPRLVDALEQIAKSLHPEGSK